MRSTRTKWLGIFLLITLGGSSASYGQWVSAGPAVPTNHILETVGGITYFTHTSWVPTLIRIYGGAVTNSGTNITALVERQRWTGLGIIPPVPDPGHVETHVTVLGALPPGDYSLQLECNTSYMHDPWPTDTVVYQVIGFTVSQSDAALKARLADGDIRLSVQGTSNAIYTIESSTNLLDWNAIVAQTNAPFEWNCTANREAAAWYYRLRVEGN